MYRPYSSSLTDSRPFLDVQSLIRNLAQDFVTSFNTGNYDQVSALFAQDGAFMAPHYDPAYGPKAVERLLRQIGEAGYEDLRLETVRVEASGDLAMEIGRYTVAIRRPDGAILADRGKYLRAWRRLGAWLIVADCWSSNLPLPMSPHATIERSPAA
jgi:ketosteroid isomerase-like protein